LTAQLSVLDRLVVDLADIYLSYSLHLVLVPQGEDCPDILCLLVSFLVIIHGHKLRKIGLPLGCDRSYMLDR